jgi:heme-degrading monooxygenase HmoA
MFVALWEFDVKPGYEERFETIYAPSGDWARLFRRDPHYQETRLLRDPFRARIYVTMDVWDSREAYTALKKENREEYDALDKSCEGLTVIERCLGCYERIPEL